jgi:hypothetical protein
MDSSRLTYTPLPDATPQGELDELVAVYKFVLKCHESKKAADPTNDPNEAKEDKELDPERSLPQ